MEGYLLGLLPVASPVYACPFWRWAGLSGRGRALVESFFLYVLRWTHLGTALQEERPALRCLLLPLPSRRCALDMLLPPLCRCFVTYRLRCVLPVYANSARAAA